MRSATEVVAYTEVRGGPAMLPLAAVRSAVAELLRRQRGPGWSVTVRTVSVLRLFREPDPGDVLTTDVTCEAVAGDEVAASARCTCAGELVATVTARIACHRDA
ncbi:MAG TPA: hypothetical protein VGG05_03040 [Pseudonocardiaceae bacterium]